MAYKAFGIVAEYNPFHKGHEYLIDQASALTKADVCISAMSGNFVQRGDFAYFDKWKRAEEAVKHGVDLVVELPQAYGLGSAGYFASKGVGLLSELDCDYIVFGSETGELDKLLEMSKATVDPDLLRDSLDKGMSYPKALGIASQGNMPSEPNDILATEYLKAIEKYDLKMEPVTIKRKGEGHNDSASALRRELELDSDMGPVLSSMKDNLFDLLRYEILNQDEESLEELEPSGEGLGKKLKNEIRYAASWEDLMDSMKSKRYTRTRISRLLYHVLLRIDPKMYDESFMEKVSYIRPLAMTKKGASYLKRLKKEKDIIVIDNIPKSIESLSEENLTSLKLDIKASDIYNLIRGEDLYKNSDYVIKPAVLR